MPEPPPLRTTEEILARAEEYAIFEGDDFDGVMMTPEEYAAYRARRRP